VVRYAEVRGLRMAYRETGSGPPIVFLHGNPTSSYLWRNILRPLAHHGRCVAPDLVGMGASDPLPDSGPGRYRFVEHREYLDALLVALGIDRDVVIVGHDWGGVLGIDWARRHPDAVRGIAYMETLVAPVSWHGENAPDPGLFGPLRTAAGEPLVLRDNVFVEKVLPAGTRRALTDDEMAAYRAPYVEPGESRRPTLTWPREIPIDGHPADVAAIVSANAAWMAAAPVPKLFVNGDPGALLTGPLRELCRRWPHQREVTVPGLHFLPEDAPREIAAALDEWITALPVVDGCHG
jgi:haloalkane dehalogenase